MKKRVLSVAICICMILAMGMPTVTKASTTQIDVRTQSELVAALASASTDCDNPTIISLTADIQITSALTIPQNTYVTIQSKGSTIYELKYTGERLTNSTSAFMTVNGDLTISNVTVNANELARVIYVGVNKTGYAGSVHLKSGATIENGRESASAVSGLGIYIPAGTEEYHGSLTMEEGATITKNYNRCGSGTNYSLESVHGAGVAIEAYTEFTMTGGEISYNGDYSADNSTGTTGAGVYVIGSKATFNMSGGTIANNTSIASGAGLYVGTSGAKVVLSQDAAITDNSACWESNGDYNTTNAKGGGIYIASGTVQMYDQACISNNKVSSIGLSTDNWNGSSYVACGGGVFVLGGSFEQYGGTISNNTVSCEAENPDDIAYTCADGGGVFVQAGTYIMNGGSVQNNEVETNMTSNEGSGNGGGVYVGFTASTSSVTPGTFTMTGGSITDNNTTSHGKDLMVENHVHLEGTTTGQASSGGTVQATYDWDAYATPLVQIEGAITIGDAFLRSEAQDADGKAQQSVFTVTDSLENASIGLVLEEESEQCVVALEGDAYDLEDTDADAFVYDSQSYEIGFLSSSKIGLVEKGVGRTSLTDAGATICVEETSVYTGEEVLPAITVKIGDDVLEAGTDYSVSYKNNIEAGEGTVIVRGIGSYKGKLTTSFTISPADLSATTAAEITSKYYTGEAITPAVSLTYQNTELVQDTDYSISYEDNTDVGEDAKVILTGTGNYTGTKTITFSILDASGMVKVDNEEELVAALENASDILITTDFSVTQSLAAGENLTIYGNGNTLTYENEASKTTMLEISAEVKLKDLIMDGAYNGRLLMIESQGKVELSSNTSLLRGRYSASTSDVGQMVYNSGELQIQDAQIATLSKTAYGGAIYNAEGANLVMEEGASISNIKCARGGAVINLGTFTLNGGTISECRGESSLAAAVTNKATFEMNGGTISGSSCERPAVYNTGTFCMTAGEICDNTNTYTTSSAAGGGAVWNLGSEATITMTGGSIHDNVSYNSGGGIFVGSGSVTVNGEDAKIINNKTYREVTGSTNSVSGQSNGGGVFVASGEFVLENGLIEGNSCTFYTSIEKRAGFTNAINGGGVFVYKGTFKMNGGTISNNTLYAQNEEDDASLNRGLGAGVYVDGKGTFVMNGGTITGNASDYSEPYEDGIHLANQTMDSSSTSAVASMTMTGAPVIDEVINLPTKTKVVIGADGLSGSHTYQLYCSALSAGSTIVVFADETTATQAMASYFTLKDGLSSVEYDEDSKSLIVGAIPFSALNISLVDGTNPSYIYTGKDIKPEVMVTASNGEDLSAIALYDYEDNLDVGEGTVTISGDGTTISDDSVTFSFTITQRNLEDAQISVGKALYTTKPVEPDVEVLVNGYALPATDYDIEYENNIKISNEAVVKITAASDNVTGEIEQTFSIVANGGKLTQTITGVESSYTKTYSSKTFSLPAKATNENASLSYESSNTKVVQVSSKGVVKMTGYGKATITITAAKTDNYKSATKKVTIVVKPKQASLKKVVNKKSKSITVKWKKDSLASGYQIQIATNKKFTKNVKYYQITKASKTSKTISGLKKGKTYYIRILAYNKSKNTYSLGAYSSVKKVKIKK
ncbi:fibronectin type III domain-containing protein [Eubacterium oxidoreducens]